MSREYYRNMAKGLMAMGAALAMYTGIDHFINDRSVHDMPKQNRISMSAPRHYHPTRELYIMSGCSALGGLGALIWSRKKK